jgi:Toprim domain-containing protein/CHC2-type zinc finger protein/DNA polymerase family A
MSDLFWDVETRSAASLRACGSWRYAADPTTEMLCLCYAVDDGPVETWLPGQPPPAPFLAAAADPTAWRLIAHNAEFERAVLELVLVPKHGFPSIPLAAHHCSMALALANAYPAQLELLAQALALEYRKDRDGVRLMRQMSQPRKPRKGEDKSILHWVFDAEKLARLIAYCQQDVRTTRAVWRHPKLVPLSADERRLQIFDAEINRRGVRADRALTSAARDLAQAERARINAAIGELTSGEIDTVDQVQRIRSFVNSHGHAMTTVGKHSVAAVLAGHPCDEVRRLLELRRDGARASVRKYERILSSLGNDDRLRGTMQIYGAGPGRWSGRGPQLQNLKKNEAGIPLVALEAVRRGDRDQLCAFGNPLTVLGDIARAVVCAGAGNILMAADFGAIESRVLAWLAGEQWKLDAYRDFDATGDKAKEPYRLVASKMLHKPPQDITTEERRIGKAGELACGFGGSVGAWRRIASNTRSDDEILNDVQAWRQEHPKTTTFWRELARAIRIAIRTGQPRPVGKITTDYRDGNLILTLPSGRSITYPEACLVASRYEGGDPDVQFMDNANKQWRPFRGWFGIFVENVVQGVARDLLAAAIERLETCRISVVLHVHDELVAEVPIGTLSEAEFLAILLEPPAWAEGLPLAGTVWSGSHYLKPPKEDVAPAITKTETVALETAIEDALATLPEEPQGPIADDVDNAAFIAELSDGVAPLLDLVSVPLTANHKAACPFHDSDDTPSLQFYADHFHCFGCGEHGGRLDWLMRGEGMTREEAIAIIRDWEGPVLRRVVEDKVVKVARALALWHEASTIRGTWAERYLAETRGIDISQLPADLGAILRFHPRCPFGPTMRHPCLLALMRQARSDERLGIQRIALTEQNGRVVKLERRALGKMGVVKLWPPTSTLVVGEGLETTLAAATCILFEDAPLRPAWAVMSADALGAFPVLPEIDRLIILVDHDPAGAMAASACTERWTRAGRTVVRLTPEQPGADFNDLVMPESVS